MSLDNQSVPENFSHENQRINELLFCVEGVHGQYFFSKMTPIQILGSLLVGRIIGKLTDADVEINGMIQSLGVQPSQALAEYKNFRRNSLGDYEYTLPKF